MRGAVKGGRYMEMRITGKRLGGTVRQAPAKNEGKPSGKAPAGKARQDRLEISKQAAAALAERAQQLAGQIDKIGQPEEKEPSTGSTWLDHMKKELDVMDKCARISASISSGDRVPPEDLKYLKEHDMNAYRLAMVTRKPKKDPTDKESVLSEEDKAELEGRSTESTSGGGSSAPAEGAPAGE